MTHFIYLLWFLALLSLAGELDRRWGAWVCDRFLPELSARSRWYWAPLLSLLVPGSGQLLNQQPAKGLLCFLWPFLIVALNHAGQPGPGALWWLLFAWYGWVMTDALLTALTRPRRQPHLDPTSHD